MAKAKLVSAGDGLFYGIRFNCPGCEEPHTVVTRWTPPGRERSPHADSSRASWGFDGNLDRPTLTPSILVTGGHYMTEHKPGSSCYCTAPDEDFKCVRCHSFVRDGMIEFLSDCSHELAGKTVELQEIGAGGDA